MEEEGEGEDNAQDEGKDEEGVDEDNTSFVYCKNTLGFLALVKLLEDVLA